MELFVEAMENEIQEHRKVKFYLATDDMDVRSFMIGKFGHRIITNSTSVVKRDTKEGMMDAALDLFALAHTRKIYGSYHSTYSWIASFIRHTPLQLLIKQE